MREIPLVNGMGLALVDDEDYPELSQYQWYLHPGGAMRHVPEDHTTEMMHTRIIGAPGKRITHLDGNHLNNQRANLSRKRPPKALKPEAPACSVCGRRGMLEDGLCRHCRTHPRGPDGVEQKLCPKCLTVKPITDYYSSRGRPSGWCKDCAKALSVGFRALKALPTSGPRKRHKADEFMSRAKELGGRTYRAPGGFMLHWKGHAYMVVVCWKPENDTILVPRYCDYQSAPGVRELRVTDPDDLEKQMLECPDLLEEVSK